MTPHELMILFGTLAFLACPALGLVAAHELWRAGYRGGLPVLIIAVGAALGGGGFVMALAGAR